MEENSIILQGTTTEKLVNQLLEGLDGRFESLEKNLRSQQAKDELLTREQACDFLRINSSTLWAWTNKGKVTAYGISNRRYYKRSELLNCLTELKK